jgi:hypothetical protein
MSDHLRIDTASYRRIMDLLASADEAHGDMRPSWPVLRDAWRAKAQRDFALARAKARRAGGANNTRYARRKANGRRLNGRGIRASAGNTALVATGRMRDALAAPETYDPSARALTIGVDTRGARGAWLDDRTYIDVMAARFGVWRKLTAVETAGWGLALANDLRRRIESTR